jgi:hypothetical protein
MFQRSSIVSVAAVLMCVMMFVCSKSPTKPEPVSAPMLTYPRDSATFMADTLTLTWFDTTASVTSYSVQVATDPDFSTLVVTTTSAEPFLAITSPLTNNTTYFWRVSASNGKTTSAWSAVFSFTTGVPAPIWQSPMVGGQCISLTPALIVNPVGGAVKYYFQLSTDSAFATPLVDDSTASTSFAIASPLADTTIYYWRAAARIPQGRSGWSDKWNFETGTAPFAGPTLVSPDSGTSGVSGSVTLTWNAPDTGTLYYELQVSSSSDFSPMEVDMPFVATTSQTIDVGSFASGTTYYWRVAAKGDPCYTDGDWSAVWSFTMQ